MSVNQSQACCALLADENGPAPLPNALKTQIVIDTSVHLATVDWGTAMAPIYKANDEGVALHVWVDETQPRNQGMSLTAWELGQHGVPHTIIVDNAGGHLMQLGMLVIVGTDRTTASGDVCNKIGTYMQALAARDNGVPFYVAAPSSSIDFLILDGIGSVPIEKRSALEVTHITGLARDGSTQPLRKQGRQLCLRRDARAAGNRSHHGARFDRAQPRGTS